MKGYYEDFYFKLIQFQYEYYKEVINTPEKCIFKDMGFPSELIISADLNPVVIEMILGLISQNQLSIQIIEKADQYFYSTGICSFNKLSLPALDKGILLLPKGFACMTACQEAMNSFSLLANKFKKPCLVIDLPYENSKEAIKYVAEQYEEAYFSLCKISGSSPSIDHLREIIRITNETINCLYLANQLRKKKPALFFGGQMLKFVNLRMFFGINKALEIAKEYYRICQERYNNNNNTIVKEKFRILWCNLGIMYDNSIFEYLEKDLGAIIVFEEMNYISPKLLDEKDPFISLAKNMLDINFIGNINKRIHALINITRDYKIDGIIFFSHINCRLFNPKFSIIKETFNKQNIPVLELSGDCLDKRSYNKVQLITRLEAFIEMLNSMT